MLDETAINYFIGVFNFGNLPLERVLRSMDLFVKEVVPGLKESTTVPLYGVPGPIS
jgi:hypothetical protein